MGIEAEIITRAGYAHIALARALLVADFLAGDGTDFVFVDADVFWEPGALVNLVLPPVDFVAGLYPSRHDEGAPFYVNALSYPVTAEDIPAQGLWEVASVPGGFTRITRTALEQMVEAYPESAFPAPSAPDGTAWALLETVPGSPNYLGEDFSFCLRWRQIGGKVWVDPALTLSHVGEQVYNGSLAEWAREHEAAAA